MSDQIENTILVASGKGGVGKSTVAANLALAFAQKGFRVGLLDADIYGPSVPTMFGTNEKPVAGENKKLKPIQKHGISLMSMGFLVDPGTPMVWRGPMLAGAVIQFVNDVEWGPLDYLFFDLPPGTGDIQLSLAQKVDVRGAVLVTTPQDVALADVVRAKAMFDRVRIETLGVVENMSYFLCDGCDKRHEIFAHGGGKRAAADLGVSFLGDIPLEPSVRSGGDEGTPILANPSLGDSVSALSFGKIADRVAGRVAELKEADGPGLQIVQ